MYISIHIYIYTYMLFFSSYVMHLCNYTHMVRSAAEPCEPLKPKPENSKP